MIMFNSLSLSILILVLVLIIILISTVSFIKIKKLKRLKALDGNVEKLLNSLNFNNSLEANLTEILSILPSLIAAPSYALYIYDSKNNTYLLKAIRQSVNGNAQISPAYSGLLPYKKESFFMPHTLAVDILPKETGIFKYGEVPLIGVAFENKKGLLAIGPVSKLSSKDKDRLNSISSKMNPVLTALIETEDLRSRMKLIVSSRKAVKNVSSFFTDIKSMLNVILEVTMRSINANGSLFILEENGQYRLEEIIGLDENIKTHLINDSRTHSLLFELVSNNQYVFLNKSNKNYFKIPPYFVAEEMEMLLLVKIASEKGNGLAAFWYNDNIDMKDYQIAALKVLSQRIVDILNNHKSFEKISASYIHVLKTLAKLVDNLSKHTIGYSELMYRYAVIICRELKLSKEATKEIALAAYLSNIGVIGLSDKILTKQGKYDEIEYEMMKLHADAGASIIEATVGNPRIAAYIRYHHERIDGFGYPEQLKGDEIPLGAKIIAVIQTYLAKILSREYRKALPFDQALNQLKTARGTQLDSQVVDALINWFRRKQLESKDSRTALGRCFEMRCSSESVCVNCPAYKSENQNCWEHKDVNCSEHGGECEDCFIYTEYKSRANIK